MAHGAEGAEALSGFRYVLFLPDGEPAEPAMFLTAIPTWKMDDTFLAGPDLTTFRILEIEPISSAWTRRAATRPRRRFLQIV